jgi:phosphoglycerate dehydrogenase-like enzyme
LQRKAPLRVFVNSELGERARSILSDFELVGEGTGAEALGSCVAALLWPFRLPDETWTKLSGVRVLQTLSAGVDGVRFDLLPRDAVVLSNAGAYAESVGEHAWSLVLGAAKGLHQRKVRSTPRPLRRRTLLVLGCGAIGCEVARLARVSLSMRTIGVSRSFRHPEYFDEVHPVSELAAVASSADVIVLALPLTVHTRSMLNYDILCSCEDAVIVANVGRGETVDEESMYRILKERPEARYVTDVYWEKDGKESFETRLWDLPNFAGTLHTAGMGGGRESLEKVIEMAARNLREYLREGKASNLIDKSEYSR